MKINKNMYIFQINLLKIYCKISYFKFYKNIYFFFLNKFLNKYHITCMKYLSCKKYFFTSNLIFFFFVKVNLFKKY